MGEENSDESRYQLGLLTVTFIAIALLKNLVFSFAYFRITVMIGGLTLALVLCRNIELKVSWSRKESLTAVSLVLIILLALTTIMWSVGSLAAWGQQSSFFTTTVMAPISEEIVFRLFLLNLLLILTASRFQALLISSVLFMSIHIGGYYASAPMLLSTFFGGVVFGIVFLATRSLSFSVALHAIVNLYVTFNKPLPQNAIPCLTQNAIIFDVLLIAAFLPLSWGFLKALLDEEEPRWREYGHWFFGRNDRSSNAGFAVTFLSLIVFVACLYLFPFYAETLEGSKQFYLLGPLGLSQFQITGTANPLVPDPLLLPVVTIVLGISVVSLIIEALYRMKSRGTRKTSRRRIGAKSGETS